MTWNLLHLARMVNDGAASPRTATSAPSGTPAAASTSRTPSTADAMATSVPSGITTWCQTDGVRQTSTGSSDASRDRSAAEIEARPTMSPPGRAPDRLRLATWNLNSLRARLPAVERFLDRVHPDVLCLQETKAAAIPDATSAGASSITATR